MVIRTTLAPSSAHDSDDTCSCTVIRSALRPARARELCIISGLKGLTNVRCYADSVENAQTAIMERLFFHEVDGVFTRPFVPHRREVSTRLRDFGVAFDRCTFTSAPVDLLAYAASAYRGLRERQYHQAALNVLQRGTRQNDARLRTFIKHEKVPMVKKRPVPRVIQPRTREYNVSVGRYLRHLEHPIYHAIARVYGAPTVMKGYNSEQVARHLRSHWESIRNPVAVGLDASRFDQHVSVPMLTWEHQRYLAFYRGHYRRELAKLLKWQLTNSGTVRCPDGKLKYTVSGTRCSGDMNTALGNCLLMCAMVWSYCRTMGVQKFRLVNNGDDCVLIVGREDVRQVVDGLPGYFAALGFVMKVEKPVDVFEQISFCQTNPVWDGAVWRMVRDPRISLSKDATLLRTPHNSAEMDIHLNAIGECGLALTGGLPVLEAYYSVMTRAIPERYRRKLELLAKRAESRDLEILGSGMYQLARGMADRRGTPITVDARVSFARAFGISPQVQVELEDYFNHLAGVPYVITDGAAHSVAI